MKNFKLIFLILINQLIHSNAQDPPTSPSIESTTLQVTSEVPTTTETTSTTTTESTTTTTTTTTRPSRSTPSTSTSTTQMRPALKFYKGDMTTKVPEECFSFKYSRISNECCNMPKFEFTEAVVTKCKSECEKSDSHHCCIMDCKYREMEIYSSSKGFDKSGIIKGFGVKDDKEWEKIVEESTEHCVKDQESKDTTTMSGITTTEMTTTTEPIFNGFEQGTTVPESTIPTTTTTEEPTEALKVRQEKEKYCGIPLYVYLIVTCVRIQNFVNCPNFNSTSEECASSLKTIKSCGSNLQFRYV